MNKRLYDKNFPMGHRRLGNFIILGSNYNA